MGQGRPMDEELVSIRRLASAAHDHQLPSAPSDLTKPAPTDDELVSICGVCQSEDPELFFPIGTIRLGAASAPGGQAHLRRVCRPTRVPVMGCPDRDRPRCAGRSGANSRRPGCSRRRDRTQSVVAPTAGGPDSTTSYTRSGFSCGLRRRNAGPTGALVGRSSKSHLRADVVSRSPDRRQAPTRLRCKDTPWMSLSMTKSPQMSDIGHFQH